MSYMILLFTARIRALDRIEARRAPQSEKAPVLPGYELKSLGLFEARFKGRTAKADQPLSRQAKATKAIKAMRWVWPRSLPVAA